MHLAFPYIIILLIIFTFFLHRHDNTVEKKRETFLEKEAKANQTRRQNIDDLDYLTIPLDRLPFMEYASGEIKHCQNIIQELSKKRILNLSGYSNTDLKLTYGVANLELLSQYDDNYNALIKTIALWGEQLMREGHEAKAVTVLEYGIECDTDISSNYYILADYYAKCNEKDKIVFLKSRAQGLNTLMRDSIVSYLSSLI